MVEKFDYAEAVADAEEMIAEFGASATIRRTTNSGDAWNPTQTTADYACTAVVTNYATNQINGTLIQRDDRRVYVSTEGLTVTPTPADRLIVSGISFAIVDVIQLNTAGTVVFYEIQARA